MKELELLRLLERAEIALLHALKSALGPKLKPVNDRDKEAVAVLNDLRGVR